jgi:hypothetical protein
MSAKRPQNVRIKSGQKADQRREEKRREESKGETPLTPQRFDPATVPFPKALDTPEFRTAWGEWCACRASKRKPITASACAKQLEELAGVGVANAIAAISKSIASDWQGLFPERVVVNPRAGPAAKQTAGEHNRESAAKALEILNAARRQNATRQAHGLLGFEGDPNGDRGDAGVV